MSRLEIRDLIRDRPGVTSAELAEDVGINVKNVRVHLRKMEKDDTTQIFKMKEGTNGFYHYYLL